MCPVGGQPCVVRRQWSTLRGSSEEARMHLFLFLKRRMSVPFLQAKGWVGGWPGGERRAVAAKKTACSQPDKTVEYRAWAACCDCVVGFKLRPACGNHGSFHIAGYANHREAKDRGGLWEGTTGFQNAVTSRRLLVQGHRVSRREGSARLRSYRGCALVSKDLRF